MDMELYSVISTVLTLFMGGGWFINYRANKRKAGGEATQAEADGWKAQQDVYQQTIADLKESCEYIRNDRDLLRKENEKLRNENIALRDKINEMEDKIFDLSREVARQGRKIESLTKENKREERKDGNNKKG